MLLSGSVRRLDALIGLLESTADALGGGMGSAVRCGSRRPGRRRRLQADHPVGPRNPALPGCVLPPSIKSFFPNRKKANQARRYGGLPFPGDADSFSAAKNALSFLMRRKEKECLKALHTVQQAKSEFRATETPTSLVLDVDAGTQVELQRLRAELDADGSDAFSIRRQPLRNL